MAFTHYHENGTAWFTTKTALSSFDVEDLNEQSAGFYSKEMSSKDAAAELEKIMPELPETLPEVRVADQDIDQDNGQGSDQGNGQGNGRDK